MGVTAVEALVQVAGDEQNASVRQPQFEVVPADARPPAGRMRADRRHLRLHLVGGGDVHLRGLDARDDEARVVGTPAPVGPDIGDYTLTDLLGSIFDLTHRQLSRRRPAWWRRPCPASSSPPPTP
ncbi:hypothetical protein ABZY14_36580 [Streptomyces sp. NPDC006617]|uniref:hypothetical protein n=1 Tax=Streptomyces sp. NPDC006617 TaxID=3155354 RepID=UPI0033B2517F